MNAVDPIELNLLAVVRVPTMQPFRYEYLGTACRYEFGDMFVTARHVLAEKRGGEMAVDLCGSIFETDLNGETHDSPITHLFSHPSGDISVGLLGGKPGEVGRPRDGVPPSLEHAEEGDPVFVYHFRESELGRPTRDKPKLDIPEITVSSDFKRRTMSYQVIRSSIRTIKGLIIEYSPTSPAGSLPAYTVEFDSEVGPGVSGAPVFAHGKLIGVVSSSDPTGGRGLVTAIQAARGIPVDEDESRTVNDLIEDRRPEP